MAEFCEINVGPFATNALDLVDKTDLVTKDGRAVRIKHFTSFHVWVDGEEREFYDNLSVSSYLNHLGVGRMLGA